ncbi:MAG: hypothetical protein IJS15_04950 [Victivallales bacterium]|nr:hypothetical protein [Victivallales bacterium]
MKRNCIYTILLFALFLLLTIPRLWDVMGQDEASHYDKLARMLYEGGWSSKELITFSPHGYPLCALVVCKILHSASMISVRLCGLLLWLITLSLIAWRDRTNLALLMLACFPAVCQAVAIVEIDQTFLPLVILIQVLAFERLIDNSKYLPIAAAAFALALWGRLTTSVMLCTPLLFSALLKSKQCALRAALSMLLGALLFLVSWWLYCHLTGVDFSGPFCYLKASFMETTVGERSGGLSKYAQNIIYLCLWGFNPFLALLFMLDGVRRVKRFQRDRSISDSDTLWLCAATIILGYTVIGGSLFGFPKYQIPALPLVALCLADALKSLNWDKVLDGFAVVAALLFLTCGDGLFFLRMTLREHMVLGTSIGYMVPILLMLAFAALLALTFYEKKTPLAWKLCALALGCNLAWSIRQSASSYSTGYIYGDTGECRRVAEMMLNNGWTNRRQLVHVEIAQQLGLSDNMAYHPNDASTPEEFANLVKTEMPDIAALSYAIMPIPQFISFKSSKELADALQDYLPHRDGHLFYWTRKP